MKSFDINSLLLCFPKKRPPLSKAHSVIYSEEYLKNRNAETGLNKIVGLLESWMHQWIAYSGGGFPMLEIGAGTLNHLRFEEQTGAYDIIEPFTSLYENKTFERRQIRNVFADILEIPDSLHYQRIISIAVLEHLTDLPMVLARAILLMEPNGAFFAGVPSEGSFAWGTAWRCTTALSFKIRRGISYKEIMHHEHINSIYEIEALLGYFFQDVKYVRFPFRWLHGSFYTCFKASKPYMARATSFIASREGL